MSDYINPPDINDSLALGDVVDDATLQLACSAVTTYINNWCGRDFRTVTSSARYFHQTDSYCVPINDASTVSAVATDTGDGLYSTVWAAGDWLAQPVGGVGPNGSTGWPYTAVVALGSRLFTATGVNRRPLVKVTAVWGWAAVPDDVTLAALFLAEETFKAAKEAPFGSANMADFGPVQIRGNRRVDALLAPYKTMTASDGRFLVA